MIRVLVVDDHDVVRQGLRFLLAQEDGIDVVGECSTAGQVSAAVATFRPAVVLLDVFLPDGSGLDVLGDVTEQHPEVAVVVLTSSQDEEHLLAALRAGAVSYLPKTARVDQVVAAVRAAARGESVLEPRLAARLVRELRGREPRRRPLDALSPREVEVLTALSRGQSNREIARALSISEETVKTHVSSILAKLQLADRTQAAIFGLQQRLVPLDEALSRRS